MILFFHVSGSLELGYIDKNPNQALTSEGLYFKANNKGAGVRRIRSTGKCKK